MRGTKAVNSASPKKRGRPPKYLTEEEIKAAKRAKNRKAALRYWEKVRNTPELREKRSAEQRAYYLKNRSKRRVYMASHRELRLKEIVREILQEEMRNAAGAFAPSGERGGEVSRQEFNEHLEIFKELCEDVTKILRNIRYGEKI